MSNSEASKRDKELQVRKRCGHGAPRAHLLLLLATTTGYFFGLLTGRHTDYLLPLRLPLGNAFLQVFRKPFVNCVNLGIGVFVLGLSKERAAFWKQQTDAITNILMEIQVCSILIYKFGMLSF